MSNKHFTHLHLHTEYSLLDGAIRIKDLMRHAKDQGWQAIGMSDHGNIFGAVKFFQEAKKHGLKPVLGCEMYLTPDIAIKNAKEKYYHLIVIVQNRVGYQNLCRLMAYAYQDGFYFKPRIDYKALEKYNEGLIISTACVGGHIPTLLRHGEDEEAKKWIKWGVDVFGKDRFFLELMPVDIDKQVIVNKRLTEVGKELGVHTIITGDAHYLCEEDHEAHEILLAIQTKHMMSDPNRMTFGDFKGHLKSTEHMLAQFPDQHDAVWRTGEIADSCEFDFETDKLFFPKYPIPQEHTEESFFEHLCQTGLEEIKKNGLVKAEEHALYDARLTEEVNLIIKMGYVGYFLITSDFIRWAKENDIPVGPGRGSAAGSLVAWAMQITNVDPIRYNLLFERFLNPERVSMPDIDIDFCVEKREDVINYVRDKYGHDSVCQIITFGTMMAKGVIKDVARTLGFPFQDANNLTNLVPDQLKITLQEAFEQEPQFTQMMEGNPEVKHLLDVCRKLEGLTRHASKHAAGVVISPEPLRDVLPLYVPSKSTELVTQYAMTELETLGFLKMDFLGLKNLTIIQRALEAIEHRHGKKINLDKIALDDPEAFKLLAAGRTSCVFQFESSGIKDVLVRLHPTRFEDLIAVNALYRPGPLGSGMVDDFIDRKNGKKRTTYMFKELEPILSETYGVIVYQEQVMKIASTIAGYSLGGADILRRAMGKKKVEVMAEQRKLFVQGAVERSFDKKKAGELFDLMAYFAGYGFNKSHSTAYALIAYHTAYLKANYPTEFMAAVLSFETNDPDKLRFYLQETHEMGIAILPPSINHSHAEFRATDSGILFGLKGIKNVGGAALDLIIEERAKKPFKDLYDFCKRIDMRTVNKRIIESLICAGAFDSFPGYRSQQIDELETIMKQAHDEKEQEKTGQMGLFGALNPEDKKDFTYAFAPQEEWSTREKLEREKEVLGFYISDHPLTGYKPILTALTSDNCKALITDLEEKKFSSEPTVTLCTLLQAHKVITTKKGDKMAFAQCEDLSGHCEVVIFPKLYKKVELLLHSHTVFIISGAVDITAQQLVKIKASDIIPLEFLFTQNIARALLLQLPANHTSNMLTSIENFLLAHKSVKNTDTTQPEESFTVPVGISFSENDTPLQLKTEHTVTITSKSLRELERSGIHNKIILS